MRYRTSVSHPLRIAALDTPAGGRIGMTFCPGKRDPKAMTGPWDRDIEADLRAIVDWGASAVVTLMEVHELTQLGVPELGGRVEASGMRWLHLPIRDVSIPGPSFETAWETAGEDLRSRLWNGQRIVVHCRGGLGRTGLVAARLLIELGEAPDQALARVRAARPGAVETCEQEKYVLERVSAMRAR
ncbi:MAG: cyclin-dependent kinase inhibitor 3 family protein [Pseudomonadota bacterium]|nr:cyclin-dependent kinase inhibitor 3 family protein [Pseudomonadota bacterium]